MQIKKTNYFKLLPLQQYNGSTVFHDERNIVLVAYFESL